MGSMIAFKMLPYIHIHVTVLQCWVVEIVGVRMYTLLCNVNFRKGRFEALRSNCNKHSIFYRFYFALITCTLCYIYTRR